MAAITFLLFMFAVFPRNSAAVDLGRSVCQDMWNKATNNLMIGQEINVNPNPNSPEIFFLEPAGKIKTDKEEFGRFKDVLESLNLDANTRKTREERFLSEICKPGGPMEVALKFLKKATDETTCVQTLQLLWFGTGMVTGGFRHTFIGERTTTKKGVLQYSGFHNWYQLYLQQKVIKDVQFITLPGVTERFLKDTQPPFMTLLKFTWDGAKKGPYSTLFVGTSPAFELALFSTCFLMIPLVSHEDVCQCNIGRSLVTVEVARKDKISIKTAYPKSVSIPYTACTVANNDRTDCGFIGIDKEGCEKRGCCWFQEPGQFNTPWPLCFYPTGHKCHGIVPDHRNDCGYVGITRQECENSKSCCFDNHIPNVPFCFEGNP